MALNSAYMLLSNILLTLVFKEINCCAPQPPYNPVGNFRDFLGGNVMSEGPIPRAYSFPTTNAIAPYGRVNELPLTSKRATKGRVGRGQVKSAMDLYCVNFDSLCRWHNAPDDQLEFYRAVGTPNLNRLQMLTSTSVPPQPPFIYAMTTQALSPTVSARLVSDSIPCQEGQGQLRFRYWTTPMIRIRACVRTVGYVAFIYCSPNVVVGNAGSTIVYIPGPYTQPFELVIIADNFVYKDNNLQGGLVIIDNIEYSATFCAPNNQQYQSNIGPSLRVGLRGVYGDETVPLILKSPCLALNCKFDHNLCQYKALPDLSFWKIGKGLVQSGNSVIPGDASLFPFNSNSSYAYTEGHILSARLESKPFLLQDDSFLKFSYYKPNPMSILHLYAMKVGEIRETLLFSAPMVENMQAHFRWIDHAIFLKAGAYNKVTFEVRNLPSKELVGLDEIQLLDANGWPSICR
ncbi:hypothetical protein T02_3239 [Trichinella nativa]|uniref:MAM domain-containing protein n=1 Tax=Trichinella nativa TaxID=6335 RepID=A0A0V1L6N5_9BILA|nr:hypothetical protein T06_9542 [Trichinella sp. T6]KRZ55200.1 hypothetical protein T02_3239 [Trichinella nativa]